MLKYPIRELKENYQIIDIRCSSLNSFMNPSPFAFTNDESRAECMIIGDSVHHIAQNTMLMGLDSGYTMAREARTILSNLAPFNRDKEMKFVINNLNAFAEITSNEFLATYGKIDAMEVKYQVQLECSGYMVNFSGTVDGVIFPTADNMATIVDIKTSGSKWNEEKAYQQRQQLYYAFLYNIVRGTREPVKFVYFVLTKQKTVQYQMFERIITFEEAENVLRGDLKRYLTDITTKGAI